jgi:cytoplasmic iron level regulating protein YaaA (DUF328/UPF0246 family)
VLVVLPPSETKRDGGVDGSTLDLGALGFPALTPTREIALARVRAVSRSVRESIAALGLGPTQRGEIDRNRRIAQSPLLPALERYTGVLYDGLAVADLSATERAMAARHVAVHSALFGLIRATDPIPAYRLSHDSRLPGGSLRSLWRGPITSVLAGRTGLLIDVRSEAYAALGPMPAGSWYLRVVSLDARGRRAALSHFNKKAKGEFVRALLGAGRDLSSAEELVAWGESAGIRLEEGAPGELDLVVVSPAAR